MDAAVLQWTDADRRRMRMGEVTAATRYAQQRARVRKPEETEDHPEAEAQGEHADDGVESEAHAKARVAREKAQWREEDKRRRSFDEQLRQNLTETRTLAAQNGIPQLTAMYQAQKDLRNFQSEKDEATTDISNQMAASNAQIQSLMSQTRDQSVSWQYRKSVLSRARLAVADHLSALHTIQDNYYAKFAQYAGNADVQADLSAKASDIDQRRRAMDEYYGVLTHLASSDNTLGVESMSSGAQQVAPEIVKNSSTMRLMARRRRNFWADIA